MKTFRNVLAIALLLCALTAFLSVGAWAEGSVSPNPATVNVGSSVDVTAYPSYSPWPEDLNDVSFSWSSESANVTISNEESQTATVNGIAEGMASVKCVITYTAKADPTLTASENAVVTVNVVNPFVYVESIQVSDPATKNTAVVGVEKQLSATVLPENATKKNVSWTADNGAYISQDGKLIAYNEGDIHVTVTALDGSGVSGSLTINASRPAPDPTLTLTPETMSLVSGNSGYLQAEVGNVTGKNVIWTSSGNVTVYPTTTTSGSSVTVTAKSGITTSETATVTATVEGTYISKTCTVTITPNGVKHINVTADDYYPKVGETITVTANIEYSTPGDQVNEWKFDSSILQCTEVKGNYVKFKALKAGYSKVTAVSGQAETYIDIEVGGGQTINHQITYGNYATFDGTNPLYFITNEYISNFKGVTVDGYALTNGNQCSATSSSDGHILVALNPAYLKLLSSANYHTIQIYSTVNQPATGYFRNYGTTQTIYGVRTGDDNNIALWVTLCVIGFAGAAGLIIAKRKDIFGKSK